MVLWFPTSSRGARQLSKSRSLLKQEAMALRCSWCKRTIHQRCQFRLPRGAAGVTGGGGSVQDECDLGELASLIIPAGWIVLGPVRP